LDKKTAPMHFYLNHLGKHLSHISRLGMPWVLALSAIFIFYNYLRGVRAPNLWAATQMLWNYEFGVIRRALIGDILRRLNIDAFYTYANFFYFSHVILLLQLLLIFYWFKYCLRYISNGGIYLSHWFASLAIVVHIHFVGYLDNILIFIMVGVALLPFYPALMLALCIIGTLCHELFLFVGVPLLLFRGILLALSKTCSKRMRMVYLATASSTFLICTAITYHLTFGYFIVFNNETAIALEKSIAERTNFPLRKDNIGILHKKNSDVVNYATEFLLKDGKKPAIDSAVAMLPSILFNCLLFGFLLSKTELYHSRWPVLLCYILACASPLLLFPLAWDYLRWFSHMGILSFLLILTWISNTKEKVAIQSPVLTVCFVALSLYTLTTHILLFNGYESARFPFFEHWVYLDRVWSGFEVFPRIPGS
jgi:hypothetical protein